MRRQRGRLLALPRLDSPMLLWFGATPVQITLRKSVFYQLLSIWRLAPFFQRQPSWCLRHWSLN